MTYALASAPAKINLALRVGGLRPDGYHPLDTVFEALDLYDDVEAHLAEELSLTIEGLGTDLPVDDSNLVIRAAKLLRERHGDRAVAAELVTDPATLGAELKLTKRIPVAGGMAGGSADAAATLIALNKLWKLSLTHDELMTLGAELGSDVPFALHGSIAHGQGRGEVLQPVRSALTHSWVLLVNPEGLSTPLVFKKFDEMYPDAGEPASTAELRGALSGSSLATVGELMVNDLQEPAAAIHPPLANTLKDLNFAGAGQIVSGAGPTIAILTDSRTASEMAAELAIEFSHLRVMVAHGPARGAHLR